MGFDPYQALNLPHSATPEEIKRSYHALARKYHPDRRNRMNNINNNNANNSNHSTEMSLPLHPKTRLTTTLAMSAAAAASTTKLTTAMTQAVDFAEIAAAYAILSDPRRKAEYDHIYKYGGYDDDDDQNDQIDAADGFRTTRRNGSSATMSSYSGESAEGVEPPDHQRDAKKPAQYNNNNKKKKAMGIGYTCHDPILSYLLSNGRVRSRRTVAGVRIPSRFGNGYASSAQRWHCSVSTGECSAADPLTGQVKCTTQTTHFYPQGKDGRSSAGSGTTITQTKQTIVHVDGRQEVVCIETDEKGDSTQRRYVIMANTTSSNAAANGNVRPKSTCWWQEVKDKLTMCYHPCTAVTSQ